MQPCVFQQWNPFTLQYDGMCWNAQTGQYESVESIQNRLRFKQIFGEHLRRQTQVRVVDTYLAVERKEAQKKFCSAHNRITQLKQTGHCGHCKKNTCPLCAVAYAADVRTTGGHEEVRGARKARVKRRFDKFVNSGDAQSREKRMRGLFKQPDRRSRRQTSLPAVSE